MRAAPQRSVHDFGRIAQHVAGEVGIALRGAGIAVPAQRLHHVERDALIDEKTRKRVPQIVQPQVLQTRARGYAATETTTRDMAGRLSATGKRNRSRQVSGSNRAATSPTCSAQSIVACPTSTAAPEACARLGPQRVTPPKDRGVTPMAAARGRSKIAGFRRLKCAALRSRATAAPAHQTRIGQAMRSSNEGRHNRPACTLGRGDNAFNP